MIFQEMEKHLMRMKGQISVPVHLRLYNIFKTQNFQIHSFPATSSTEASESLLVSIVYIPFERCNLRSVSTLITSFSPFVMTRLIFRRDKFKFIICNRLRNKENFITHTWSSSQCVRKVNFVIDDAMDNSLQVELRLRWRFRRISVKNIL